MFRFGVNPLPDAGVVEQVVAFGARDELVMLEVVTADCTLVRLTNILLLIRLLVLDLFQKLADFGFNQVFRFAL